MSATQWANIGDDTGALHALVQRVAEQVPVSAIDYLWIFPARKVAAGESIVLVVGGFDVDPARRRVFTAHFLVNRNRKGAATVTARFAEHASAPDVAVPRVVQGVLRRLGEDAAAEPREERIGGEQQRWDALIVELGGRPRSTGLPADATESAPASAPESTPADSPSTPQELVGDAEIGYQ
jgi:hypothetical protein